MSRTRYFNGSCRNRRGGLDPHEQSHVADGVRVRAGKDGQRNYSIGGSTGAEQAKAGTIDPNITRASLLAELESKLNQAKRS